METLEELHKPIDTSDNAIMAMLAERLKVTDRFGVNKGRHHRKRRSLSISVCLSLALAGCASVPEWVTQIDRLERQENWPALAVLFENTVANTDSRGVQFKVARALPSNELAKLYEKPQRSFEVARAALDGLAYRAEYPHTDKNRRTPISNRTDAALCVHRLAAHELPTQLDRCRAIDEDAALSWLFEFMYHDHHKHRSQLAFLYRTFGLHVLPFYAKSIASNPANTMWLLQQIDNVQIDPEFATPTQPYLFSQELGLRRDAAALFSANSWPSDGKYAAAVCVSTADNPAQCRHYGPDVLPIARLEVAARPAQIIDLLSQVHNADSRQILQDYLSSWRWGERAAKALAQQEFEFKGADLVHYKIALRDKHWLQENWHQVKNVLWAEPEKPSFAYAGVSILLGRKDFLNEAEQLLDHHGRVLAQIYVNSGHPGLAGIGTRWAYEHGYVIRPSDRNPGAGARWGG